MAVTNWHRLCCKSIGKVRNKAKSCQWESSQDAASQRLKQRDSKRMGQASKSGGQTTNPRPQSEARQMQNAEIIPGSRPSSGSLVTIHKLKKGPKYSGNTPRPNSTLNNLLGWTSYVISSCNVNLMCLATRCRKALAARGRLLFV